MSVYEDKLKLAEAAINANNEQTKGSITPLDWSAIQYAIKQIGGTSDECLREMTWEDLQSCGIPRVLARRIANQIFRKSTDSQQSVIKPSQVAAMSFSELFENYDPSGEKNSQITKRLEEESKGRKCVVFNADNSVDVAESTEILRELKDGLPERDRVGIRPIYAIGQRPNQFFDENFLFPGEILRNGRCDRTDRKIGDVPQEARQIVYLAITKTNELVCATTNDAHSVIDMLECDDPISKAQARFPVAALALQNMIAMGQAPSLKMKKPSGDKATKKTNNPFGNVRT